MSAKIQLMVNFQNNVSVVLSTINSLLGSFYYECTQLDYYPFNVPIHGFSLQLSMGLP